ncbi:hypothetical protein OFM39_26450, partial [Escherichia coli]|nr:hypothetical protein [Escherichia coli]
VSFSILILFSMGLLGLFLRTAVNYFMDCVLHIWCPLFSQEFQDLPDGAETTLTICKAICENKQE